MELYKIGKIVSIGKTYVILETNYTGYITYVARPDEFVKDKVLKLYTYEHHTEYLRALYGFAAFEERILFEDLISVNGVGPKTALSMLKIGTSNLIAYIANGDAQAISSLPQIGIKTAQQLVFELKEKYMTMSVKKSNKYLPIDIASSLKTLGFNQRQIEYAVTNLSASDSMEALVENAIKLISSAKFA